MRIACPTCDTAYEVPESALKPGRKVRCARCETQWAPPPVEPPWQQPTRAELERLYGPADDDDVSAEPPEAPAVSAMDRLSAYDKRQQRGRKALAVAWVLTAVVLIGLLAAGVAGRRTVMAAWPPSMRLYGLIGLSGGSSEAPEAPHADPKG